MNETNKGYKFKFETEDVLKGDSEDDSYVKYRFTAFGDTAEETVQNHEQLREAWSKMVNKSANKIDNKTRYK